MKCPSCEVICVQCKDFFSDMDKPFKWPENPLPERKISRKKIMDPPLGLELEDNYEDADDE